MSPTFSRPMAIAVALLLAGGCASAPKHDIVMDPDLAESAGRDDANVYTSLIRRMQGEGAYYASLAHIEAYRMRHGASPELRLLEADALRETGQPQAAATIYRALTGTGHAAAAWHGLGLIAAAAQDTGAAEQALLKASSADPLNAGYLGDLGFLLLSVGELGKARAPLAKASELAPASPKALANLALWASLSGDNQAAESIMQKAKLSDASRQEIRRLSLAFEPRVSAARRQALAQNPSPDSSPAASPGIAPIAPPQGMLQRFRPATPSNSSPH